MWSCFSCTLGMYRPVCHILRSCHAAGRSCFIRAFSGGLQWPLSRMDGPTSDGLMCTRWPSAVFETLGNGSRWKEIRAFWHWMLPLYHVLHSLKTPGILDINSIFIFWLLKSSIQTYKDMQNIIKAETYKDNNKNHKKTIQQMQQTSATQIIILIPRTMFMVLSSWLSHCESSPGSRDGCRAALADCRPLDQAYRLEP